MDKNKTNLEAVRHSAEHVLTQAMLKFYPKIKMAMGPAIPDGFYFDFESDIKIFEADFPKIEAEMAKIIKKNLPFKKEGISIEAARKLFANNPYKQEWLDEIEARKEKATVYWTGDEFVDLCKGPHVDSTGKIGAFKLLSVAGAYWHGDEKNKMLTRIYGTAFPTQKELDEFLKQQEEAKKRDHRKLGKELDLFTFSDLVGAGLPLYTPKGALLRKLVNDYVESVQVKQGYTQVWTPQIAKAELFKTSGHYDKYKDLMFRVVSNYSDEEFFLKPMNCPQHTQIYASKPRSYKDLPIRLTDFAMLYRDEKPGELSGLARVRSFSQDDCHIFCREDQVDEEVDRALSMIKEIMKTYNLKYKYRLSTHDPKHPEKYIGDPKTWEKVEKWAEAITKRNKIEYFDGPGEAAFYAPKMDLIATDSLGREWQLSTVQIDFFLPERFKLVYTDSDGKEKRPVMIHRAIVGSPERFLMILIEHFAGNFPTWLTPVQVKVLPITDRNLDYAQAVVRSLKAVGIRTELDDRNETLPAKIRDAQLEKVAYMLIVGDKEAKAGTVSVRKRSGQDLGARKINEFISIIKKEIEERKIN
ncbi:threonine--tRNA ligase [Candidatus Woesebacteria bacterium CG07_land_8_20_14_0_80_44_9]|uniref:Threonine--tRNA ligase n=3 Tax=Candidatus Woeseibacteriota TaxID=1752722 RepID=A0A2M6YE66_9BACT|nr:MAG: threonine--tRNA ligase [Candidatus Woesebacteria bacterium CG07_land_8_20_14_0_80_44_9]PIZ46491.1 MAG: threonine--tRNA ligase [Candidatus Woesebacteria bacterium CG_4_10_14_0_2_um_filter_44_9]